MKKRAQKLMIRGKIIALMLAVIATGSISTTKAAIVFQDDDFSTVESSAVMLGSNDAGAANTAIQFGADLTASENGNITWNISTNHFNVDHAVDITGGLTAAGNISTSGGGTITSDGLLTATNGLTQTTGALNLTATSGTLSLSGLSPSSISAGSNALNFTSTNFTTTSTGINSTAIGATTASTGVFTTLQANTSLASNGSTTLGDAATDAITLTGEIRAASPLVFEGATDNNTYTTFAISDPTTSRTITFPDATGTVSLNTLYQNQNIKTATKIWTGSATTTSGVATFTPTDDNTASGNALFTNIYSVQATAQNNTGTAINVPSAAIKLIAANKKSITVNVVTGQNIGILGAASAVFAADGTVVTIQIVGD